MNRHPPQQKGGPLVGLDQGFRPNPAKQALIPRRFCRSTSVPQVNARRDSPTSSGMRIPLPITLDSTAAATQNGQSRAESLFGWIGPKTLVQPHEWTAFLLRRVAVHIYHLTTANLLKSRTPIITGVTPIIACLTSETQQNRL